MSDIQIRPYKETDYELISSWWEDWGSPGPVKGEMVEDGTFVAAVDGAPIVSLTVFLTQSRGAAYFEGFISSPHISRSLRREAGQMLWDHGYQYARDRGYSGITVYAANEKIAVRYEELGMTRALVGLTALHRRLDVCLG